MTRLGKTNLELSRFGLGTGPFGAAHGWQAGDPIPESDAVATMRYSCEHGVRLIDTAPFYGAGIAERYVGAGLRDLPRAELVISTKVGRIINAEGQIVEDYSRDGVFRSLEGSLKRMNIDQVEMLHIHDADNNYHEALDAMFPALAELRAQGTIKAISAGMNQWQILDDFANHADFDCFLLAGRYTLLEQGALDFLNRCQQKGIGILLAGIYNSGILVRGAQAGVTYNYQPAPSEILERVRKIEAVCARFDVPLRVAALQFALAHPAVTTAILGAAAADEVEAFLSAQDVKIAPDLWVALQNEGLLVESAPVPA